jgi:hypothetical protein
MTIWLVLSDDPDGQDYFESVHATKQGAEAAAKACNDKQGRLAHYYIRPQPVEP